MKNKWKENLSLLATMINIGVPIFAGVLYITEIRKDNAVQNEKISSIANDLTEMKQHYLLLDAKVDQIIFNQSKYARKN